MKKTITLLAALLLTAFILPNKAGAQSCSSWAKKTVSTNEDQGTAVATDASGNVYYLGNFYSQNMTIGGTTLTNQPYIAFNYGSEMFLAKYDSCGTFKWAKKAGGNSDTYGAGLATDAAGNVYVTGYFRADTAHFDTTKLILTTGYKEAFLVKYDGNGHALWAKQSVGSYKDEATAVSVDAANNIYVSGVFSSASIAFGSNSVANGTHDNYTNDVFIAKFDNNGNNIWVRGSTSGTTNTGHALAFGASTDGAGNVYVAGRFECGQIQFGSSSLPLNGTYNNDIFLVKYDASGNVAWLRSAGSPTGYEEGAYAVASDAAGNTYITGYIGKTATYFTPTDSLSSTTVNKTIFIAKYDASGNFKWARKGQGRYWSDNFGTSVALDAAGNAYITGTYSSDTLRFGPILLRNTSYVHANPTSDYYYDVFTAKYKPNGTLSWVRSVGGDSTEVGNGIATGPNGALYVAGSFNSPTITFGSAPTLSLTAGSVIGSYNPGIMSNDAFLCNNISMDTTSPKICLVSSDSVNLTAQYNVVYWDKTPYTTASKFIIYREVTSGIYKAIGSQPYSALSRFVDTVRHIGPANGDPLVTTYRYKIQYMDTAGAYSMMSPYHNTVYFQNNSGNFTWNLYTINNPTVTPVLNYYLMRDDNSTGAWHSIGSTTGTGMNLNDPNYATYQATANWRVDADTFNCTPTYYRLGNNSTQAAIIKSKSNISNNRQFGINTVTNATMFNVYPNPAKGSFVIETSVTEKQSVQVYDINGKIVLSQNITGTTNIDASTLPEGVYNISITNSKNVVNKRLVIVK
jgi:hypothetical protein